MHVGGEINAMNINKTSQSKLFRFYQPCLRAEINSQLHIALRPLQMLKDTPHHFG